RCEGREGRRQRKHDGVQPAVEHKSVEASDAGLVLGVAEADRARKSGCRGDDGDGGCSSRSDTRTSKALCFSRACVALFPTGRSEACLYPAAPNSRLARSGVAVCRVQIPQRCLRCRLQSVPTVLSRKGRREPGSDASAAIAKLEQYVLSMARTAARGARLARPASRAKDAHQHALEMSGAAEDDGDSDDDEDKDEMDNPFTEELVDSAKEALDAARGITRKLEIAKASITQSRDAASQAKAARQIELDHANRIQSALLELVTLTMGASPSLAAVVGSFEEAQRFASKAKAKAVGGELAQAWGFLSTAETEVTKVVDETAVLAGWRALPVICLSGCNWAGRGPNSAARLKKRELRTSPGPRASGDRRAPFTPSLLPPSSRHRIPSTHPYQHQALLKGPRYENVVKSYKAHESTISLRELLNWGVPGVPDQELGLDDKLTEPPSAAGAETPETLQQCPNCQAREDVWLAPPHSYREGYNFFSLLGHLCIAAKIRECRRKKCLEIKAVMQAVASLCEWQYFRDWALVAMSCQQAFTMEERLSAAYTHLVNVVFSCHELVGCLDQFPRRAVAVQAGPNTVTAIGAGTRPGFPAFLSGVATQMALREADSMAICRNRLWNMLGVSDRKQFELLEVITALRSRPWIRHPDHQLCTQTRCQGAHLDSSRVDQLHKNPEGRHGQCSEGSGCEQLVFPINLILPPAVEKGERTAWSLEASPRLLRPGESYLAISHVWSEGTGVGRKAPGSVNDCLLGYFSAIARALECDGTWWDAISLPTESSARTKALGSMHTNYQGAKCTVAHDPSPLHLEWTDPESACLALAMSPWFTRGWTALELAMS
ncbi:hypothetical protein MAPG_09355, partial [Magnaporthiopsis poae ATCC 64411]